MDRMKILRENSVFWSKLGYYYDPPRFNKDGKIILFASDFDRFTRIQEDFAKTGIKIFSSILFSGWIGVDMYDYELTDKVLDAIFSKTPDILYIPRIKLNVPIDWCSENPEDVFVYYNGPRDVKGICALVDTPKHDILGYDSSEGYTNTFGHKDDRPNVDGVISLQSFSSKKWLANAGTALNKVIKHIEDGPYGERVLAYHIAYGVCGETSMWGRYNKEQTGDWGIANRKAFFDWGMMRYGSIDKLRNAWNNPKLLRENAEPPTPSQQQGPSSSLKEFMRKCKGDQIGIDYDLFVTDMNVNAMEHFGRIVKNSTNGKPVGYFYGYVLECANAASSGWLGYERVLNSPYIDFLAAPKSYYRNSPGQPGGYISIAQSINRKKLWIDEIDNHTYLAPNSFCKSFNDTRSVLWREFSKNLAADSNFWWMDLGGGWYNSPELQQEIKAMEKIALELRKKEHKSIAQVLLIVDEMVFAHTKLSGPPHRFKSLHRLLLKDMLREFNLTGAPVDLYRLSDLEDMDISQYRLIVPLNAFVLNSAKWSQLKARIPKNTTIFWNYAPGVVGDHFSLDNITRLTDFSVRERKPCKNIELFFENMSDIKWRADNDMDTFPVLEIVPEGEQQILGRYSDGGIAMATTDHCVYCTVPLLKAEHLRSIMKIAGCHFYAPVGTIVYADNRFIAVFSDAKINFTMSFPAHCNISNAVTGETYSCKDSIPLSLKKHSMCFFTF